MIIEHMHSTRISLTALIFFIFLFLTSCEKGPTYALISTEFGDIKVLLYDSTPRHKENFIKLVNERYYDGLLFHRIMQGFMIQGGDPDSRDAAPGVLLGNGGPDYTLEHEIGAPHIRGALAAARQPDAVNPEKRSSGSQFYIVDGKRVTERDLANFERMKKIKYNDAQRQLYLELGGSAVLDGEYTVFGEVVSGIEVVDEIAKKNKDGVNRPLEDIKMTIKIL